MSKNTNNLKTYLASNNPNSSESLPDSIPDLLYESYTQKRPIASQIMRESFQKLDKYLASLPEEAQNAVFQLFCSINSDNERLAFLEGIHVGAQLAKELSD